LLETILGVEPEPEAGEGEADADASDKVLDRLETDAELRDGDPWEERRLRAAVEPTGLLVAVHLVDRGVLVVLAGATLCCRQNRVASRVALAGVGHERAVGVLTYPAVLEIAEDRADTEARAVFELDVLVNFGGPEQIDRRVDQLQAAVHERVVAWDVGRVLLL